MTKLISEIEVENWLTGLTECSYDKKQRTDPPTREVIGTPNERYIVTKKEILDGIKMVRQFASIASIPTNFNVPDNFRTIFDRSKAMYALMLSVEFTVKNLVYYSNERFSNHKDKLVEIDDKLVKLTRFVDTMRTMLVDLQKLLGEPDQQERTYERQVARVNDRPARSTEGRKNSVRKPFSLASKMAGN